MARITRKLGESAPKNRVGDRRIFGNFSGGGTTGGGTTPVSNIKENYVVKSISINNIPSLEGAKSIDGITTVAGDYILLVNQISTDQNGVWIANAGPWSKITPAATLCTVAQGDKFKYTLWERTSISGDEVWQIHQASQTMLVDAATIGNITLSGTQLVDGVSVGFNEELVLCTQQTNPAENGVYISDESTWIRYDITFPKIVIIADGLTNISSIFARYNDLVFNGTNEQLWVKVGGAELPDGTLGDTMYYNGTDWVANPSFKYTNPTSARQLTLVSPISQLYQNISLRAGNPPYIMVGSGVYGKIGTTALSNGALYINSSIDNNVYLSPGDIQSNSTDNLMRMSWTQGFIIFDRTTSVKTANLHKNYLQSLNLNNTGKQRNLLISASGHVQSTDFDRSRIDTQIPMSSTSLFNIISILPTFNGSINTAYTKTYSYKFTFKLYITFNSIGGQGGIKVRLSAKSGLDVAMFEMPSLFKISPLGGGISVDDHYADMVDYNDTIIVADLSQYDNRSCLIEGEAFINDFAFTNVVFAVEVGQNSLQGSFDIEVGSYCDYEVCNTDNP